MKKCKNCGHAIRSTKIWDSRQLKHKNNYPHTHVRHDYDGRCMVKGCKCNNIMNAKESDTFLIEANKEKASK